LKEVNKKWCFFSKIAIFAGCLLFFLSPWICWSSPDSLGIFLNPTTVKLMIDGPPKRYVAEKVVKVAVRSGISHWVLQCQATSLKLKGSKEDEIPPERLLIAVTSPGQKKLPSEEDFTRLDEVVVITQGGYTGPSLQPAAQLWFALESRWEDKPGEYEGKVLFTYIANP